MQKLILNVNYQIEVLSEKQLKEEEIVGVLRVISTDPEIIIKEQIKIENKKVNPIIADELYTDYFRFYKKN